MQGKIAHAAERKSFEIALDHVLKSSKGDERERAIMHVIDIAEKLLDRTVPRAADGMREALYPGSKWERWLFEVIDEDRKSVV